MENFNHRIIVTGGMGYIGSELLNKIKNNSMDYLSIDKINEQELNSLCLDLGDYEKIFKVINDFKPSVLIHCGTHSAIAYKDHFFESFIEDFKALVNILKSITPDCKLIYFSSSYVYSGLPIDEKFDENTFLLPKHNFGVAKSFFEQFILRNHKNSVIFRLSSVFGKGEGRCPNTILNFVKDCIERGRIEIWGYGNRKIQYIFMDDVLNYVFESFHMDSGIYNLGGEDYVSVADVAKMIAGLFGSDVIFLKDKPEGETLPFIDNDKLKLVLNKNLFTPFSSALMKYLILFK